MNPMQEPPDMPEIVAIDADKLDIAIQGTTICITDRRTGRNIRHDEHIGRKGALPEAQTKDRNRLRMSRLTHKQARRRAVTMLALYMLIALIVVGSPWLPHPLRAAVETLCAIMTLADCTLIYLCPYRFDWMRFAYTALAILCVGGVCTYICTL